MTDDDGAERGAVVGLVYCVQVGADGPIKIGWAVVPVKRMAEGQTWHWERLRLLGSSAGGQVHEALLHTELVDHRMAPTSREWFQPDPEVLAVVARITVDGYDWEQHEWEKVLDANMVWGPTRLRERRARDEARERDAERRRTELSNGSAGESDGGDDQLIWPPE